MSDGKTKTTRPWGLGQEVSFEWVLERLPRFRTINGVNVHAKVWLPKNMKAQGVLVGYRRLCDGYTRYVGSEEGNEWIKIGDPHYVALVAYSLNRNPAPVHLAAITPLDPARDRVIAPVLGPIRCVCDQPTRPFIRIDAGVWGLYACAGCHRLLVSAMQPSVTGG